MVGIGLIGAAMAVVMAVAPSDRMAMADRLFNRGRWAEAQVEYAALVGEKSIPGDALLYRLAECDRAMGKLKEAREKYGELLGKYPASELAARARLNRALAGTKEEQEKELPLLDEDGVEASLRAAALYHLGVEKGDAGKLEKCLEVEPKGKYAMYAKLHLAGLLEKRGDEASVRRAVGLYLDVAFGGGEFAEEALYLAAVASYRGKRYGEADSLMKRYLRKYAGGKHADELTYMCAWCGYLTGKYADAIAMCEAVRADASEAVRDSVAYVKAIATYSGVGKVAAQKLLEAYLVEFPRGAYREGAEGLLARVEFEAARQAGDGAKMVESLKRVVARSKASGDRLLLGWAYEKAGRGEEAAQEYAGIAKDFPGTADAAEAMYRKAMGDLREERWGAADLALQEALAGGKLAARLKGEALYWRGFAAVRLGHEAEGAAFLQEALKGGLSLDQAREARLLLADNDYRAGRVEQAKEAYRKLVAEGAVERMGAAKICAVGKLLGGEEAKVCAQALIKLESAEWRQCGYAMLGKYEQGKGAFAGAMEAYRKCLGEKCVTEDVAAVALELGELEARAGEWDAAEATLKRAVELNGKDAGARAKAYLNLAKVAKGKGDVGHARKYATVVTELFEGTEAAAGAAELLKALGEEEKEATK